MPAKIEQRHRGEEACCAHLFVKYDPEHVGGLNRDRWLCGSCGRAFEPVSLDKMRELRQEVLKYRAVILADHEVTVADAEARGAAKKQDDLDRAVEPWREALRELVEAHDEQFDPALGECHSGDNRCRLCDAAAAARALLDNLKEDTDGEC